MAGFCTLTKNSLFVRFYLILCVLGYIVFSPFLLIFSLKKKYKLSIPARFFLKNNPPFNDDLIWFHVCSFGEANAIAPIALALQEKTKKQINVTSITQTGFLRSKDFYKNARFLPFEVFLPFWIKKQKILIVLEAELWLMLFFAAFKTKTPTMLLNARISEHSYHSYLRFKFFYKHIFKYVDYVLAQSQEDKQRLETLGAKNVEIVGNIKLIPNIKIKNKYKKPSSFLYLAASTHRGEEKFILNSWHKVKNNKLIIAPRHPERFAEVAEILSLFAKENNLKFSSIKNDLNMTSDLILFDIMGELNELFAIADLVILGGAFEKIGGHNFVEPAFFNKIIITGEHTFNQKSIIKFIQNIYVATSQDELSNLLENKENLKKAFITQTVDKDKIINKILEKIK